MASKTAKAKASLARTRELLAALRQAHTDMIVSLNDNVERTTLEVVATADAIKELTTGQPDDKQSPKAN